MEGVEEVEGVYWREYIGVSGTECKDLTGMEVE